MRERNDLCFNFILFVVLEAQPQQCYSSTSTLVTQSGSLIFANGIRKTSVGPTKPSIRTQDLTFEKHLTSADTSAIGSFSSGPNRTSAISGKRSTEFDTASLPSGNSNNQPETANAMLLVQSQQVSTLLHSTWI